MERLKRSEIACRWLHDGSRIKGQAVTGLAKRNVIVILVMICPLLFCFVLFLFCIFICRLILPKSDQSIMS